MKRSIKQKEVRSDDMKRLFLMRHAKSSWDSPGLSDFERPLNDRGLNTAPFMGELISRRGLLPELFISSPAVRAMQTAKILMESSGSNAVLRFDERIYEASPNALRQVVSEIDDSVDSVMLIGHNPGLEGFIDFLTSEHESMPTASVASIDLEITQWKDLAKSCGRLVSVIRPKDEAQKAGG